MCVQACVDPLNLATAKATMMLHANAFVHQYEKYGVDRQYLRSAVHASRDVIESYESM